MIIYFNLKCPIDRDSHLSVFGSLNTLAREIMDHEEFAKYDDDIYDITTDSLFKNGDTLYQNDKKGIFLVFCIRLFIYNEFYKHILFNYSLWR